METDPQENPVSKVIIKFTFTLLFETFDKRAERSEGGGIKSCYYVFTLCPQVER